MTGDAGDGPFAPPGHLRAGAVEGPASSTAGTPFEGFDAAAEAALSVLQAATGLQLWMITRTVGAEQVVLTARGGPGRLQVPAGTVLAWDSALCQVMAAGDGPVIAPVLSEVPPYAAAANAREAGVNAYVGMPLRRGDGELFGTLCAFDTRPQPQSLYEVHGHVELIARLLATVLDSELAAQEQSRVAEQALAEAERDALTGLANRRAWDLALVQEEARCRRYGHRASVLVVDLDGLKEVNDGLGHEAGDELLRACARRLRRGARRGDVVARLGGDEFAVLLIECDAAGAAQELHRVRADLAGAGIAASSGVATRAARGELSATWREADAAMYAVKRARP